MARARFVTTEDIAIEQPYPGGAKRHYDAGVPVMLDTEGRLFTLIRDRLREADGTDHPG